MAGELTFTEKSVLFILMAEAREIQNAVLASNYQTKLEKPSREKLTRLGLINVRQQQRRLFLELTDLGWKQCTAEFGAPVPARAGAGGAALYAILGVVKRYLDRADLPHAEFFSPADDRLAAPIPSEVEARIRRAYEALAREPGAWVKLADVRDRLDGIDQARVDGVLMAMNRKTGVRVIPESNQKTLTQRDWDAAVIIGNQHKHLIAIES